MTIYEFESMTGLEKIKTLTSQAVFLAKRPEGCFSISLYQIEAFYVEIYFHTGQHKFVTARTFNNTAELEGYLGSIDISALETI
jgi:hypothetical protein